MVTTTLIFNEMEATVDVAGTMAEDAEALASTEVTTHVDQVNGRAGTTTLTAHQTNQVTKRISLNHNVRSTSVAQSHVRNDSTYIKWIATQPRPVTKNILTEYQRDHHHLERHFTYVQM